MKKKKYKLIGLVLILSAVLLQVAYAATVTTTGVASTLDCAVQIETEAIDKSDYVDVNVKADQTKRGIIVVETSNLYPGAFFTVRSKVKNIGKLDVKFKSVDIKKTDEGSQELYDNLVFYDADGKEISKDDYKVYLSQMYPSGVFKAGEIVVWDLKVGLSQEVTTLEETKTQFLIELLYEQTDSSATPGGDENPSNNNSGGGDKQPQKPIDSEVPDEPIPGGPVKIEDDEDTPVIPEITETTETTEIEDEDLPGGATKLPKTGGVNPLFVYGLGIILLVFGIIVYRKDRKQE